jgi:hypothetical protein
MFTMAGESVESPLTPRCSAVYLGNKKIKLRLVDRVHPEKAHSKQKLSEISTSVSMYYAAMSPLLDGSLSLSTRMLTFAAAALYVLLHMIGLCCICFMKENTIVLIVLIPSLTFVLLTGIAHCISTLTKIKTFPGGTLPFCWLISLAPVLLWHTGLLTQGGQGGRPAPLPLAFPSPCRTVWAPCCHLSLTILTHFPLHLHAMSWTFLTVGPPRG